MTQCLECDHTWTDDVKGRVTCPSCLTVVMIHTDKLSGETVIKNVVPLQQFKINHRSESAGRIVERTIIDEIDHSGVLCQVCKNETPILNLHTHYIGLVCGECYTKLPTRIQCRDCNAVSTVESSGRKLCRSCKSLNVRVIPILPKHWEANILPIRQEKEPTPQRSRTKTIYDPYTEGLREVPSGGIVVERKEILPVMIIHTPIPDNRCVVCEGQKYIHGGKSGYIHPFTPPTSPQYTIDTREESILKWRKPK